MPAIAGAADIAAAMIGASRGSRPPRIVLRRLPIVRAYDDRTVRRYLRTRRRAMPATIIPVHLRRRDFLLRLRPVKAALAAAASTLAAKVDPPAYAARDRGAFLAFFLDQYLDR